MIIDLDKKINGIDKDNCIVLGNFDGFHIGHQELIKKLLEVSESKKLNPSILLFKEHTKSALDKDEFKYLTKLDDKIDICKQFGLDNIFIINFDNIKSLTPIEFLNFLKDKLNVKGIIVGDDYTFGEFAKGDIQFMKEYCYKNKILFNTITQVKLEGNIIKSTNIRSLIEDGKVEEAAIFLGRPYKINGIVNHGFKRGRKLGFPTANISIERGYILPKEGVYLTKTITDDKKEYNSLSFVGKNITFNEEELKIETYILDFSGDLYGKEIYIEFMNFIRSNKKFDDPKDLVNQINMDIEKSRKLLKN
ncbi:bifunctional riboflavin kinase/FAD synthetase [Mediannikoviicoccus vaginalis]|uniref:bifunctional riboflavin kinase/FAD synthetase n=1 Tax=Mediannikoviicoccus vaginalis TaxID=2899727 RepID=UPI001F001EF5|nr:bifunctional riboflavin kinase/FAD synthetase [Mediannikoviicoccus vaginalis]